MTRKIKRYEILNDFAKNWGYENYLEIGTSRGRCLERVRCKNKTGVDPAPKVERPEWTLQKMTSDDFFASTEAKFDLIFIDGLHLAEQVLRDIYNSLAALAPGGAILLHDCHPNTEDAQLRDVDDAPGRHWNGDVWKAIAFVRQSLPDLFCRVLDVDEGIGVILPKSSGGAPVLTAKIENDAKEFFESLTYADLVARGDELLGLLSNRAALEAQLHEENLPVAAG